MTSILAAELAAILDNIAHPARSWLIRRGVSSQMLVLGCWPGPVGAAQIETHPLGMFDFAETGPRAFVHPIWSAGTYSEMLDLIAWFPDRPDRWWTRLYTGLPLGVDQLDHAEIVGEPIVLHATPLDWLIAGGIGVCVTDWAMSALALRAVPTVITADHKFGREVRRRLTEPPRPCPEIRVVVGRNA